MALDEVDADVLWDFTDAVAERDRLVDVTDHGLVLQPGAKARIEPVHDAQVGEALSFDGVHAHLVLSADDVGPLDAARRGDCVSVFALVRRRGLGTGFISGMWQEDDRDPRRQYGLFLSLPTYGGAHQVAGHVSADGRATHGLPYSREYAATARMVGLGDWRVVGFTYDGERITSYLDGVSDRRPSFREVGPPVGTADEYAKNPYIYPHGLNRSRVSDFTVGAVRLTGGMGNFFHGDIAAIAVWSSGLSPEHALRVAERWTSGSRPLLTFDFWGPAASVPAVEGGHDGSEWPLHALGWSDVPPAAEPAGSHFDAQHGLVVGREGGSARRVAFDLSAAMSVSDLRAVEVTGARVTEGIRLYVGLRACGRWHDVSLAPTDASPDEVVAASAFGLPSNGRIDAISLLRQGGEGDAWVRGLRVWSS